tara:strand:- start:2633 stop:2815 length:183 start_codon:yes stop_codon:yes gene_type:complete
MNSIVDSKRSNYLSVFKQGIEDSIFYKDKYEQNKSSAYYRKGYEFGLLIEKKEKERKNEK